MNAEKIITDYFNSNIKTEEEIKMGPEYEHIIVDRDTYKSVSYYGENGVESIFKKLVKLGWEPEYEGEHILGLSFDEMTIATEPGGQFEFSNAPKKTVSEIDAVYKKFFKMLLPILDEMNYDILGVGYHPKTKIDEIKLLPKKRYESMYEYFNTHGTMSHNMMKGTCALQLSIDYKSEEDAMKKFVVANGISNVLYSMFENAYFFESKPANHNQRAIIWENTDPKRSGLAKNAFIDDSFKGYAKYIADTESIFAIINGEMVYTKEKPIGDLINENTKKEELEYLLTMVFPDVRLKKFIEIRVMDEVPYPYNMGAFALIKGLFYDEKNLNLLYEELKNLTREEILNSRHEMYEIGEEAKFKGKSLKEWKERLVELAENQDGEDKKYLKPLKELIEKDGSMYEKTKKIFEKTKDVKEAAKINRIEI